MIFGRPEHREWTLSLYNAVNGTDYDDPSEIRLEIPVPKFVVFYNGTTAEPDEMELKLSTSFPEDKRDQADIELKVRVINSRRILA